MRVFFPNLKRPKKAAQRLSSRLADLKLHVAQEAVARAAGYDNWHELERCHAEQMPTTMDQFWPESDFRTQAAKLIRRVAEVTMVSDGDALDAVSGARLTGDRIWSLDDHIALRLDLWRTTKVFSSVRRAPGSVIRMKARGRQARICYLCRYGRPTRVLCDTGIVNCADFEAVVPRLRLPEFLPARLWQPYGFWTLRDGSDVVFSRDYFPLWRVSALGLQRLPPWLWIEGIEHLRHFLGARDWDWSGDTARAKAVDYLARHQITGLPTLADALPLFFNPDVARIEDAVRVLMIATSRPDPIGPWHRSHRFVDDRQSAA
jgi:hypothetical protein